MMRSLLLVSLALAAAWAGCARQEIDDGGPIATESPLAEAASLREVRELREAYPTVEELYTGAFGIYRGCGPNNAVCHNSREFPNLSTMGSLVQNIGVPCNEKREDPLQIHDLCERKGDRVRVGTSGPGVEIAWVEKQPLGSGGSRSYKVRLRERITAGTRWSVIRATQSTSGQPKEIVLAVLGDVGASARLDPSDPSGRTIFVSAPPPPPPPTNDDEKPEPDVIGPLFDSAGVPGDPLTIQVGDPNRNGTFGEELGGRLIAPGHPEKSYLFSRLVDPSAGPLMPRANCCFWTKKALRALWCWVAGLDPSGGNALSPIAYETCPASPSDTVAYPEPGPSCETSGMCPVLPVDPGTDRATFTAVYGTLVKPICTGSCHVPGRPGARLDMSTKERAYANLVRSTPPRVIPHEPRESVLFQRVSPELCTGECTLMPMGQPALSDAKQALIERWITDGAKDD